MYPLRDVLHPTGAVLPQAFALPLLSLRLMSSVEPSNTPSPVQLEAFQYGSLLLCSHPMASCLAGQRPSTAMYLSSNAMHTHLGAPAWPALTQAIMQRLAPRQPSLQQQSPWPACSIRSHLADWRLHCAMQTSARGCWRTQARALRGPLPSCAIGPSACSMSWPSCGALSWCLCSSGALPIRWVAVCRCARVGRQACWQPCS